MKPTATQGHTINQGDETPLIPECYNNGGYVQQLSEKVQAARAIITDPSCRATQDQQIRLQKFLIVQKLVFSPFPM